MTRWKTLIPTEHQEQAAVIDWADKVHASLPDACLIFAIPNGGLRYLSEGRKLKLEGVRSGVPDLFLPVPRPGWHGLFIEMKRINGKTTITQDIWAKLLREQGYAVCVCKGAGEAIREITGYLTRARWAPKAA
jgi:hypothetical protein